MIIFFLKRHLLPLAISIAVLFGSFASADTLGTPYYMSNCFTSGPTAANVFAGSSCSLAGGFVAASSNLNIQLSGSSNTLRPGPSSVSIADQSLAAPLYNVSTGGLDYHTSATTEVTLNQPLITDGPVQPGLLYITLNGIGSYDTTGIASSVASFSNLSYTGGFGALSFACMSGPSIDNCGNTAILAHYNPFPVRLGETFQLNLNGSSESYSDPEGYDGARSQLDLSFEFTDLHGNVVGVEAAPEPSTSILIVLPLLVGLGIMRKPKD